MAGAAVGLERRKLPVEPEQRRRHQRLAGEHAGVVDQKPRVEVVAAVGDDVVAGDEVEDVVGVHPGLVGDRVHVGVQRRHGLPGAGGLRNADAPRRVGDLPLKVGQADRVVVGHAERAHAGGREIHQQGRTQAAGADDEDARVQELRLPGAPHLPEHDVAGVTLDLFFRELHPDPRPLAGAVRGRGAGHAAGHIAGSAAVRATGRRLKGSANPSSRTRRRPGRCRGDRPPPAIPRSGSARRRAGRSGRRAGRSPARRRG